MSKEKIIKLNESEWRLYKTWLRNEENNLKEFIEEKGYNPLTHQRCEMCGQIISIEAIEVHHKKPKSEGGSDKEHNLMRICTNCHKKIHN